MTRRKRATRRRATRKIFKKRGGNWLSDLFSSKKNIGFSRVAPGSDNKETPLVPSLNVSRKIKSTSRKNMPSIKSNIFSSRHNTVVPYTKKDENYYSSSDYQIQKNNILNNPTFIDPQINRKFKLTYKNINYFGKIVDVENSNWIVRFDKHFQNAEVRFGTYEETENNTLYGIFFNDVVHDEQGRDYYEYTIIPKLYKDPNYVTLL